MILGLPVDAWLLLVAAVGLGLGLELLFYRAQRRRRGGYIASGVPERAGPEPEGGAASGDEV